MWVGSAPPPASAMPRSVARAASRSVSGITVSRVAPVTGATWIVDRVATAATTGPAGGVPAGSGPANAGGPGWLADCGPGADGAGDMSIDAADGLADSGAAT